MLKRYVLAGLMLTFAGSAFAEMVQPGRAYIPCVAGAYNCTPGVGQAPIAPTAGGPRPLPGQLPAQPIPGPGPGGVRPLPPGGPGMIPGPGPGGPQGGVGVRIGVSVGVHAGPQGPVAAPMPCGPRPCPPPPCAGGVRIRVKAGCFGCGMRRRSFGCGGGGGGCGGGGVRVNVRIGFGGCRGRC